MGGVLQQMHIIGQSQCSDTFCKDLRAEGSCFSFSKCLCWLGSLDTYRDGHIVFGAGWAEVAESALCEY